LLKLFCLAQRFLIQEFRYRVESNAEAQSPVLLIPVNQFIKYHNLCAIFHKPDSDDIHAYPLINRFND